MDDFYSMQDVAQWAAEDLLNTTNEKFVDVKMKSVAQMYANIQAEEANRLKQIDLDLKRAEQEMKENLEQQRLELEAKEAKISHRLELAKVCITGVSTLFTVMLVAVSCAKGDLGFKALKDIRLFKNV